MMKRKFTQIAFCLVAFLMVGCSSDDDPAEGGGAGETTVLTATEQKQKMENIALEFLAKVDANDYKQVSTLVDYFTEQYKNYDMNENSSVNESMSTLAKRVISIANGNVSDLATLSDMNSNIYRISDYYGIYTANDATSTWVASASTSKIEFDFTNAKGQACSICLQPSGEETSFTNEGEEVLIPEQLYFNIIENGTELASIKINPSVNQTAGTISVDALLKIGTTSWGSETDVTDTKASTVFTIAFEGSTAFTASINVVGTNFTGENFANTINIADDDTELSSNLSTAEFNWDVLGELQLRASCNDIPSFKKVLENRDDQNETSYLKSVDSLNNIINAKLYYDGGSTVQAKMIFEGLLVDSYWDMEPVIQFTSDNSKYSFEEYFGSKNDFTDLADRVEELATSFQNILK